MKKLITVLLLFISIAVSCQTYYISPTGNDANNGSAASPWKTLVKATNTVSTVGAIIHVNPGTYLETQQIQLKAGVSIEGEGVSSVIQSTLTNGEILNAQSAQKTNGNQHISGLKFDGRNLASYQGIWVSGRSNVSIYNCTIQNFKENGVIFNGVDETNPGKDPVGFHATGNSFHDNIVTNCSQVNPNYGSGCLNIGGQDGMLIYNNTITQTQRGQFGNGWPIKYWNEGWNRGCKIYNNTLTKGPYGGSYPGESGAWDFCMEFFNVQGMEIYGNTIQGSIDFNYNYKGAYPYSLWIHNNILDHPVQNTNVEGGIILEYRTENLIIENNTIKSKTYGITFNTRGYNDYGGDNDAAPGGTPAGGYSFISNAIIRNNLFTNLYDANGMGNRFGIGVISEGTDDPQVDGFDVYNNTFVGKAGNATYNGVEFTSQTNGSVKNVNIHHNIFQGFANNSVLGNKAKTQSGINISTNNYFSCAAPTWSGATITGNLNLNPQFDATWHTQNPTLINANIGWGIGTAPPPSPCTAYVYSDWGPCDANGIKKRTVISALPNGCVGGLQPVLTDTCTPPPVPCTYTYSAWGACINGQQTRTVLSATPSGCTGTPILTQNCTTVNQPPIVIVGPDILIKESFALTSEATDTDGSIATYKWTKLSGPSCLIVTPTAPDTEVLYSSKGTRVFQISVKDNLGAITNKTVTVIIQ